MRPVRLDVDMADAEWFPPYQSVEAEVDTNDVTFVYAPFGKPARVARLLYRGREFAPLKGGEAPLPWERVFGATVVVFTASNWAEASQTNFKDVAFNTVAKVVVELLDASRS